jgi:chromosome segregation ATPase
MARAGISYTNVADAADRLAGDGKNPTVDGVRELLGTGSKSTIAPLLKRWKTEHRKDTAHAELGLPEPLVQALKGVYDQVQAEAARQRDAAIDANTAELAEAQAARDRLQQQHDTLRERHDAQAQDLAAATARIEELEALAHRQDVELARVRSDNEGLAQRLADRADEIKSLTQQLAHAREQFEHYQAATARQRAEERQAAEQRHNRLEQELEAARQQLLTQQAAAKEAEAEVKRLSADHERLQRELQTVQETLAQARSARDQTQFELAELKQRYQALESQHTGLQSGLADARTALAVAEKERTLANESATRLEAQLAEASQENARLQQENAVLSDRLSPQQ